MCELTSLESIQAAQRTKIQVYYIDKYIYSTLPPKDATVLFHRILLAATIDNSWLDDYIFYIKLSGTIPLFIEDEI